MPPTLRDRVAMVSLANRIVCVLSFHSLANVQGWRIDGTRVSSLLFYTMNPAPVGTPAAATATTGRLFRANAAWIQSHFHNVWK